ncbi:MAG TPA: SDR family oxidoreductase [Abditibacteriaceae bacterium]|jgi:NAD(P)-dependent dehydrogenase (short-subunit alcohol dehydrogenase family)
MSSLEELFGLKGQTAVVIGATGALGGGMAEALAGAGARVVVVGRNQERGAACVERIEAAGGEALFQAADALSPESLQTARDEIVRQCGGIDILVNAAGGNHPAATLPPGKEFASLDLEAWHTVFDLNLVGGVLLPCQIFGETMLEAKRGSIINIASMAGMTPLSRVVAYSAAKAAVINLTKFLAREWAQRGVRVNALSPGFFPAEQNRTLLFNEDGSYTERGGQIIGHTPMGRFGEASELSGAVLWLASQRAASFVTGQNIVVDGGFSSVTI